MSTQQQCKFSRANTPLTSHYNHCIILARIVTHYPSHANSKYLIIQASCLGLHSEMMATFLVTNWLYYSSLLTISLQQN